MRTERSQTNASALLLMVGILFVFATGAAAPHSNNLNKNGRTAAKDASSSAAYGKLPLSFEANEGQTAKQVKFLSRGRGYALFLTPAEAVLSLEAGRGQQAQRGSVLPVAHALKDAASKAAVLHMRLERANTKAKVSGIDELPGKSNYFIGKDQAKWRRDIPTFGRVKYQEVYSGVDLVYYGNQHELEYDFVIAPGADPRQIELTFDGANRLRLDADDNLIVSIAGGEVIEHKPVIYQDIAGIRRQVAGGYEIRSGHTVGFKLARYDDHQSLTIDPSLVYSTYLGGSGLDASSGIAVDSSGNAYVTGVTFSSDFPITAGAFRTTLGGRANVFVSKLNSGGSALVYSTYLGGNNEEAGSGIAVDSAGNAYLTGYTASSNFPTTAGAFQTTLGGSSNAFVSKLNSSGSALVYSTYLGGGDSDVGSGIAIDSLGNAYVAGYTSSSDFPTTAGAFQTTLAGTPNAFVTKLNPTGSGLVYSTYLGGTSDDEAFAIAIDSSGSAYVTGNTSSTNFPTNSGAFQVALAGSMDGFVTKLNPAGSALAYSTYLGGSAFNDAVGIAVDSLQDAYVTGSTTSTNFPTTSGVFQPELRCGGDAYVTKLNAAGSALVYSTYLGGCNNDNAEAIAIDSSGDAYITGWTFSIDFPTTSNAFQTTSGGNLNVFVTEFNPTGSALAYSTYLAGSNSYEIGNGIAVDFSGNAYVTGLTESDNFPTTSGAFQTVYGGGSSDAFVSKFALSTCTVTYNGTFKGNLTVSSGLTCIINGTVTGNVQGSGSVLTGNSTIDGNVQITGGSFSIDAGSTIDGNLQAESSPAGVQNLICGATVKGNLQVENNNGAVEIGNNLPSCTGNSVNGNLQVTSNTGSVELFDDAAKGNLQVTNNTGPVEVSDNVAKGNLQCQGNSSISGGGNTAAQKQGQCAGF